MAGLDQLSTSLLWTPTKEVPNTDYDKDAILEADESVPLLKSSINGGHSSCQSPEKGSGWLTTAFLLVNTALGVGILNFPAAYNQAGGIYYATGIQVLMVCLMVSTMLILAYCSDVNGDRTYHDVLLSMCGTRGRQLAAVSICLTLYCVCVASLIVIGDQMDSLFHSLVGPGFCNHWYLHRSFTISTISILFVLPCCFWKRVDFLAYIGSVGIFAMLYPVFLTAYGYFKVGEKHPIIKSRPDDLSGMFAMFPVLGLGYQCQEVVVPVYSCMRDRNLANFAKSSALAMGFLFIVYSVIGCFGYLTFGAHVSHNVMKMYNADDPFVLIGVGALIIKMVATYPILALCGRDAAAGLYAEICGLKPAEIASSERRRRWTVAAMWFGSSLILAVTTSSIGVVIKYLGSVSSVNIFIYPGICLMQVVLRKDPEIKEYRSFILIAYAILVAGVGAFCVGVVLMEAIFDRSSENTAELCMRAMPSNVTSAWN